MQTALMGLRTDPSTAHGYAPSELLLGRKLVYPIELQKNVIDLTGNYFTSTLHFSQEHYHPQKVSVFTNTDSFSHQHLAPYFFCLSLRHKIHSTTDSRPERYSR